MGDLRIARLTCGTMEPFGPVPWLTFPVSLLDPVLWTASGSSSSTFFGTWTIRQQRKGWYVTEPLTFSWTDCGTDESVAWETPWPLEFCADILIVEGVLVGELMRCVWKNAEERESSILIYTLSTPLTCNPAHMHMSPHLYHTGTAIFTRVGSDEVLNIDDVVTCPVLFSPALCIMHATNSPQALSTILRIRLEYWNPDHVLLTIRGKSLGKHELNVIVWHDGVKWWETSRPSGLTCADAGERHFQSRKCMPHEYDYHV